MRQTNDLVKKGMTTVFAMALTIGLQFAFFSPAANAVHTSMLEVDGNSIDASAGSAPYDWDTIITNSCNAIETLGGVDKATCVTDPLTGDTGFTSSTDEEDVSDWNYETVTNEETPPKDNIKHAFGALYHEQGTGDQILYFGLDRDTNNGTAQVGFWFLKEKATLGAGGKFVNGNGSAAHHTNGDILVQSNFTNGGSLTRLSVYTWQNGTLQLLSETTPGSNTGCNQAETVCVGVNASATNLSWRPSIGEAIFFEGGINLTDLGFTTGSCISQFVAETRSSAEFTSQLKDFALGDLNSCDPLEVTKTVSTSVTRTQNWSIDKTVTPSTVNMFEGDSAAAAYSVAVTKGGTTDSNWAVSGNISIHNPNSVAATITAVTDSMTGSLNATVVCPQTLPFSLAGNATVVCTYSRSLPSGATLTNTANVVTTGSVPGNSDTESVNFASATVTPVNGTVNITDTVQGSLGTTSESHTYTYNRTFTCADEGDNDNTATIVETSQSDSATVEVNCFALDVEKDVDTAFSRSWDWTINKSADQTSLTLAQGELFEVNYTVQVNAAKTDNNYAASGDIVITNPAPIAATITSVADVMTGSITATVNCGVSFPYTLAANGTLECTYTSALPNDTSRTNTATATLRNHSYSSAGVPTDGATTDFTGTASVSFASATITETNECVDVTDNNVVGNLGTLCSSEAPHTYNYSLWFGTDGTNVPTGETFVQVSCGANDHDNTATCTTNDTATVDSDSWMLDIEVTCATGCTLTQGYWKTHNATFHGGAPVDDNWENLDGSLKEATVFYLTGQTWYQIFWTAPKGNAYYNLAHQYMAAKLNVLNGADTTPAVDTALAAAVSFFNSYTPASFSALPKKSVVRTNVINWAGTLGSYNEGLIGPGHCDEQNQGL
jgi:hypothetical protein